MSLLKRLFGAKDSKDQRQELEQRYAALPTAELEAIVREPNSYTPLALEVARAVLESRTSKQSGGSEQKPPPAGPRPKVVGVLVLSPTEVPNKSDLFREIARQQGRLGYDFEGGRAKAVLQVARGGFDDVYAYAAIRENFSDLGGHDLISRTYSYDFSSPDGATRGKYYVIFDRPKP